MSDRSNMTPRETVAELDRYIIGQAAAKRAVAIALRNRWRRQRVPESLRDEIAPKNIIMIGTTGVGKTEIARRLARLTSAPFIKVEASKFTEVGYVGRDVESMIRDLVDVAIKMQKEEAFTAVRDKALKLANERLLDLVFPQRGTIDVLSGPQPDDARREKVRRLLLDGHLDTRDVEIEVVKSSIPLMQVISGSGIEEMGINLRDTLPGLFPSRQVTKKMTVAEAREHIIEEESSKLIDEDRMIADALTRAQQEGIVFLDEIDKVVGRQSAHGGPDVSREGVQRDLLPIVEGCTVTTKHGLVKTDHILFIAAGAFHAAKVSDLIPELQGRFPIRVELSSLTEADFVRILREPENSLTRQYQALLATEGVHINYSDDGIAEVARIASDVNARQENIGARRLHTIMERLLEDVSFTAPERGGEEITVDGPFVRAALDGIVEDPRLENFIL